MQWQRSVSFNRSITVSSSRMDVNPSIGKESLSQLPLFASQYFNKMRIECLWIQQAMASKLLETQM